MAPASCFRLDTPANLGPSPGTAWGLTSAMRSQSLDAAQPETGAVAHPSGTEVAELLNVVVKSAGLGGRVEGAGVLGCRVQAGCRTQRKECYFCVRVPHRDVCHTSATGAASTPDPAPQLSRGASPFTPPLLRPRGAAPGS